MTTPIIALAPPQKPAPPEFSPPLPRDPRCLPILRRVASKHKITVEELRSRSKPAWLVVIRDEAVLEMRRLDPPVSRKDCAKAAGFSNHTSTIDAEARHQRRLDASRAKAAQASSEAK